jgi:hypothetical protein
MASDIQRTTIETFILKDKVNSKIFREIKFKEKNNLSASKVSKVLVIRREVFINTEGVFRKVCFFGI